jgi:predicted Zn-dependent protease
VIRDTLINAFAAPGGFIAVHSGLVEAATTPEEFAGVLAHEIQHVTQRHSTRGIIREVPMRLAIAAIAGGTGIEGAANVAGSLGALRYRRADESEADREGLRLLAAAEVDPAGMVTFMRTLDRQYAGAPRIVSYLSSHPNTQERIAQLESLVADTPVRGRPLMDSIAWNRVRRLCD